MIEKDSFRIIMYDSGNSKSYTTEVSIELFYKLLGVDNSDGFFKLFADGIKEKINAKISGMNEQINRTKRRLGSLEMTVKNAAGLELDLDRKCIDAQETISNMEEILERYKSTRREPGCEAHSISPDGETWVCDKCGTIMGRMSLYGKDGKNWRKTPRFCPGCGASNTDYQDEDETPIY